MTLSHFLSVIRNSCRRQTTLALAGSAGLFIAGSCFAAAEEGPLATNVGSFQIPFDVESEPGIQAKGFAVLFGSQDGGAHWEQLLSVPATQNSFMFAAPRDGHYSFAIRMTDARGNVQPPADNTPPELEVIVDTVAPDLKIELFESGPGQMVVNWTCNDISAAADTLVIEYTDGGSGRWKPVKTQPTISGQAMIPVTTGSVTAVRASISDYAGNRGEASSQLVSRGVSSMASSNAGAPAGSFPAAPLGPSPFRNSGVPSAPGTVPSSATPNSSGHNSPLSGAGAASAFSPATSGQKPASADSSFLVPPAGAMNPSPGLSTDPQLVNMHVFDVDYQVDDVGPSGVSAVELFITENGGQDWFRYGTDPDLRSPFQVDAHVEGTFGFAVRVRNGLGFAEAPPQPGQSPEIVVVVDETPPAVQLAQPTVRTEGFGSLELAWRVSDANPSPAPVRLEYATTQNGPWTPVFDWQADQGGYMWTIRPGTPSSLYFRLLARDAAGNVGIGQTPQPVIVDLKKPVGRLLRVQAASHSTNTR